MIRTMVVLAAVFGLAGGAAWAGPQVGAKSNPGWTEPYTLAAACGRPEPRPARGNPIPDPCAVYMSGVLDMIDLFNPRLLCVPNGAMTNPAAAQAMRRYLAAHPDAASAGGRSALAALQASYPCAEPLNRPPPQPPAN